VFRNILVAIDASPMAMSALEEAIDVARSEGGRLTLVGVAAPPRLVFSAGPMYVPYPTQDELLRGVRDVLERAEALVPPEIPVSTVVRAGSPAAEIVKRAREGEHDLVVVGSHRRGLVGSAFLGSVSRKVVARSPVPVLVAGSPRRGSADSGAQPSGKVQTDRPPTAGGTQAEPRTSGATVFLWLVVALLLECQLVLWMFDRMYAP
jgi:nucleotide-binding universal stress UspA family protein